MAKGGKMRNLLVLLVTTILLSGCAYDFNPTYPFVVESIDFNEAFYNAGVDEVILKISDPDLDQSIKNRTQLVIIYAPNEKLKEFLKNINVGESINIKGHYNHFTNKHYIDEIVLLPSGKKYIS